MMRRAVLGAFVVALYGTAAAAGYPACRSWPPADVRQRPARWLGPCRNGAADGLGVLRAGSREPFDFFLGHMAGGRPREGLIVARGNRWFAAEAFDAGGAIVSAPDSPEKDLSGLFERGAKAADATAASMERGGNPASARYYRALAAKVRRSLPE